MDRAEQAFDVEQAADKSHTNLVEDLLDIHQTLIRIRFLHQRLTYYRQCEIQDDYPAVERMLNDTISKIPLSDTYVRSIAWAVVVNCTEVFLNDCKKDPDDLRSCDIHYRTMLMQIDYPDVQKVVNQLPRSTEDGRPIDVLLKVLNRNDPDQAMAYNKIKNLINKF